MKAKLLRLQRALFTDEPNIHVRNFNLLALAGIAVSALAGLSSLFTTNLTAALLCFALCAFAVGLLVFSARTKRYRLCYYVTIAVIFLAGFSVIFFLRQNLAGIPSTLVEAALIDGCGYFKIYYAIFLPLMKGSLATQAILWFMGIWNDYLAPQVFIGRSQKLYTLQLVIMKYFDDNATVANYPKIMTASVFSMLPTLILFFIFQRFIIESVALSGIKG